VHRVSAWSEANHLVLGQRKVNEKSEERNAIPKLLYALELGGTVVPLDALGCQREIAVEIVGKKADYVLARKGNQGLLAEQVKDSFALLPAASVATEVDRGHERVEQRASSVIGDLSPIKEATDWFALASLVRIDAERFHKATGKAEHETRLRKGPFIKLHNNKDRLSKSSAYKGSYELVEEPVASPKRGDRRLIRTAKESRRRTIEFVP
jgi:predicted transposase YbfD/YdcC